jgi:hypothetical protein
MFRKRPLDGLLRMPSNPYGTEEILDSLKESVRILAKPGTHARLNLAWSQSSKSPNVKLKQVLTNVPWSSPALEFLGLSLSLPLSLCPPLFSPARD